MTTDRDHLLTAIAGAFSLVIALGIGRFLFTPALPDMIAETSLTAISGGYLAAINYGATWRPSTTAATWPVPCSPWQCPPTGPAPRSGWPCGQV